MFDFYSRIKAIDIATLAIVGGAYGVIPALIAYFLSESVSLALVVGLVAGTGIAVFIDAVCEAERTRAAERARKPRDS